MRDEMNILQVAALEPDYMGFIFYPASPRFVGDSFRIPDTFPKTIKRVGVFVNESVERILEIAEDVGLDFIQLHGDESPADCQVLKKSGLGVIKVFSVDDEFDFASTKKYDDVADCFLFDTKGKYYGGNAQTFNWEVLKKYDQQKPFFLSGGLSIDTIDNAQSLRTMNLYAFDVNSGVEVKPGLKDLNSVKAFKKQVENLK